MNGPYVLLAFAGLFMMGIIDNARGPIYPELLETFQLTPDKGSWIFTLSSLTSFLMAITVSWWLKKFQDVSATKIAVFLATICSAVIGFYGKNIHGFYVFLSAIALLGICMGTISVTINLIVVKNTSLDLQRKVLSALHAMYGLSSLVSPLVISFFYDRGWNWSYYFYALSFMGILVLVVTRNTKNKFHPKAESHGPVPFRLMLMVGAITSCYIAAEVLLSSRLVYYLVQTQAMSKSVAGSKLTIFFLFLLVGRLATTLIGGKISSAVIMFSSLGVSLTILITGLLVFPDLLPWSALVMSPFYPASISWISGEFPHYSEEIISKIMIGVGGMLTMLHIIFGQVATQFGIHTAMGLAPGYLAISLCCLLYAQFSHKVAKFRTQR